MARHRRYAAPRADGWEEGWWDAERPPVRRAGLGLPALIVALVVTGGALWWLGGPPRVPAARPDLAALRLLPDFLRGSPGVAEFRPALPWILAAAWLTWSWLVLSILLQLGVAALEILTRGAAWVRALRHLVDAATATIARRLVTGATAGYLLVRVLAATSPVAHAAPLPDQAQALVLADPADPHAAGAIGADRGRATPGTVDYVIQPGDSLWRIAERFYGDGEQYPRLLAANQGRLQSNGEPFQGLLYPGEVLLVPTEGLLDPGGARGHVVRPGETLRAIAATELGDELRWPELLVDGVPVRQALADPDLIHPGLRVMVPGAVAAPPAAGPAEAPPLALPDVVIEATGGEPVAIGVTVAPDGTPLTVTAVTQGAHGTASLGTGGAIIYTPAAGYAGHDTFTYTARDPGGRTATATIRVTVTAAAPAPAATPAVVTGTATGARATGQLAVPAPARAAPPAPTATPSPSPTPPPSRPTVEPAAGESDPVAPAVGAGLAGLALLAGGAVLLRRRQNPVATREVVRRMRQAPKPAWQLDPEDYPTDFERADLTHAFQHRLAGGEPDPAVVLAGHTAAFLRERGLAGSTVLLATHERQSGVVTVRTTAAERPHVLTLAADLGARLGGQGRGERQGNDVELRFAGPTARGLLAPRRHPEPTMVALAALPNGARLFGNYDALGHILIAGAPGEGTDTVLTSLVAELAARRAPDELHLCALASRRALPSDLLALPHWAGARVDPADEAAVAGLLARLQRALDERRRAARAPADPAAPPASRPEVVLVIGELAGLGERGLTTLAQLGQDGPAHGIRLLAATTRPAAVRDDLLASFATRAVLRLADAAQSVRLVGSPDATVLGGGGRLLLRLAGEPPRPFAGVEAGALRGLRIGAEDLAALAQGMIVHYGVSASDAAPAIEPLREPGGADFDEPAEEQIGAASVSTEGVAAPLAVADEYDYDADLAHLAEEEGMPTAGEESSGVRRGESRDVRLAAREVVASGQLAGNQLQSPASAPGIGGSWWDDGEFAAGDDEPEGDAVRSATLEPAEALAVPADGAAPGSVGASSPPPATAMEEAAMSSAAFVPAARSRSHAGGLNGHAMHAPGHATNTNGHETASPNDHAAGPHLHEPRADCYPEGSCNQDDHKEADRSSGGSGGPGRSGALGAVAVVERGAAVERRERAEAQIADAPVSATASLPEREQEPRSTAEADPGVALPTVQEDPDDLDTPDDAAGAANLSISAGGILEIACFGPQLRLLYDQRRITLSSPKAQELLAFVAVQPPGPIDREMVLHLVWPDRRKGDADDEEEGWGDEEAKSKRLRTTRWRLNQDLARQGVALPGQLVRAERDGMVVLDTTAARSDVHRFFELCDHATDRKKPLPPLEGQGGLVAACREAYALMTANRPGERRLLSGTGYGWLDEHWRGVKIEDRLRARLRHAFERVIDRCLAEGCYEAALGLLQPLFEEDYTDQAVARQLLTVYGHLGDRASVLYVDRMVRQALRRTLFDGLTEQERAAVTDEACAPARETRLLVARLLHELPAAGAMSPVGSAPATGDTPIAVGGHAAD